MNRKIKRLAAAFLTLVMLLAAFPGQMLVSYAASGKITFSDPSASVGNQVSVTMKIASTGGAALGNSDVMLEYDASALEFISGTNANGGAGSIRVVGAMESANQTTFSFTLKFKALKAGTTSITVKSQEVYDADSHTVTIEHVGNSAVKINAPENSSKDASLASLTISPGVLSPEFSADVTEYTATVSESAERITVSALANDSKASVVVEGAENLQMGDNTVACKVTAEDGTTTKTYTITVTKVEGEVPGGSEETTEAAEANAPGGDTQIAEEGNWKAEATFDAESLPEGFTVTDYQYDGQQIQAGINEQGTILIYMTDENGNGDFFVYDEASGLLAPYVTVRMAEKTIIVLPPEAIPEGETLPENFSECTIDIGEHTVHGWIWLDADGGSPEYCIVYGQNADGEKSYYRYDQKEMTLQRFFRDPDAAEVREKLEGVVEEYNSLVDDYKIRGYIIAGLFGVCILLVIILIILLLTRKPKNTYDGGERYYDDYDREPPKKKKKSYDTFEDEPVRTSRTRDYRGRSQREYEDDLEVLDLDEEDVPVRSAGRAPAGRSGETAARRGGEAPAGRTRETAARRAGEAPAGRTQDAPRQRPVRQKSVEDMERNLADSLAREAEKASTVKKGGEEADDDFEFIDLDL